MRILLPVEDADLAQIQLEFLLNHKWKEPVSFYILNVIHQMYKVSEEPVREHHYADELVKTIAHRVEADLPDAGLMIGVAEGSAPEAILQKAKEWQADLIIMASHGRTGLGQAVLGSVAYQVLSQSPCRTIMLGMPAHEPIATKPIKETISKLRSVEF